MVLGLARRIGVQVNAIGGEIRGIRGAAAPIATIGPLNEKLARVVDHAATARTALLGDG